MIALLMAMQAVTVVNYETGESLLTRCTSTKIEDQATCTAYITGVADLVALGQATKTMPPLICAPSGTKIEALRAVVVAHLRASPDDRDLAASGLVIGALNAAYPCKTK